MYKLLVIVASTRQGRSGRAVAEWALDQARAHAKFDPELVDLAEVNLPLFDEPAHPRLRQYQHDHTRRWSAIVDRADAFLVVTPEYDHGPPASILNALQYLVHEWACKAMGFVTYGGVSGGTRAQSAIKQTAVVLKMMPMVEAVNVPFFAQYIDDTTGAFDPGEVQAKSAHVMLDELLRWTGALATLRPRKSSG